MNIFIEGKPAILKENSSFEFVSENRYFSGADSYSMTITFPLKDCPSNIAIFGNINRKDVRAQKILLDCEIRAGQFYKRGSITITEINDVEVKTQFLEGRSKTNYANTFDDIYINELELGYPNRAAAWNNVLMGLDKGHNWVAIPWVNNRTGNIQNKQKFNLVSTVSTPHRYSPEWDGVTRLSYMPYMIYLVQLICENLGYTCDLSKWENSNMKYLLCCNTLPEAWEIDNWAAALPHWTLSEFFEQLEYFLNGEFEIDHENKTVSFAFTKEVLATHGEECLEKVVDEFTETLKEPTDCKYRESVNLHYADCDHERWSQYRCDWYIKYLKMMQRPLQFPRYYYEVESVQEDIIDRYKDWTMNSQDYFSGLGTDGCVYCKKEDIYIDVRKYSWTRTGTTDGGLPRGIFQELLFSMNVFGDSIVNEGGEDFELKIVPAWIDDTDKEHGQCVFLELPEYGNDVTYEDYGTDWDTMWANMDSWSLKKLKEGDSGKTDEEYLDRIYVGFYRSDYFRYKYWPCPVIDTYTFYLDWACVKHDVSMRLRSEQYTEYEKSRSIDPTMCYTFKFLADKMPDVRALFNINGQRYVCEKITATFTEAGMSQLMKGTFYRVID